MLRVEEALARIMTRVSMMGEESVALSDAHNRYLAHDIISPSDVPPWDNSAMDGYAICAQDTTADTVRLQINEVIGAGYVGAKVVEPGTASAIMTGSTF